MSILESLKTVKGESSPEDDLMGVIHTYKRMGARTKADYVKMARNSKRFSILKKFKEMDEGDFAFFLKKIRLGY